MNGLPPPITAHSAQTLCNFYSVLIIVSIDRNAHGFFELHILLSFCEVLAAG